jgi:hypothetical protein
MAIPKLKPERAPELLTASMSVPNQLIIGSAWIPILILSWPLRIAGNSIRRTAKIAFRLSFRIFLRYRMAEYFISSAKITNNKGSYCIGITA